MALVYNRPLDTRIKGQKSFFEDELFKDKAWGMKPLKLDELQIRYHAGGRLIEVLDKAGNSPLQSNTLEDDVTFSLGLFLCYKDGKWILCR